MVNYISNIFRILSIQKTCIRLIREFSSEGLDFPLGEEKRSEHFPGTVLYMGMLEFTNNRFATIPSQQ